MSLVMVHLTDLHLDESSYENVKRKYDSIAGACYSVIHDGDDVLLLFTGDITNRGRESEFILFDDMLSGIIRKIESEKAVKVYFACVPGNHDCTFSADENVRDIEIQTRDEFVCECNQMVSSVSDSKIRDYTLKVQRNYRAFISKYEYKEENCLVDSLSLDLSCGRVKIYMLNTAWCSKPKEQPGDLIFPIKYIQNLENDCDLSLVICHHPYSWFNLQNNVMFEQQLRSFVDILFFGHEHRFDKVEASNPKWNYLRLNGEELQNSKDNNMSKFAIYVLYGDPCDLSSNELKFRQYDFVWSNDYNGGRYKRSEHSEERFHKNRSNISALFVPNDKFQLFLNDLGMSVKHYRVGELKLSDIYCQPELYRFDVDKIDCIFNTITETPFTETLKNDMTLIAGDAMSGKSTLAKSLYTEFNKHNFNCLLLDASEFTSCKESTLEKLFENTFKEQYDGEYIDAFQQLEKGNKAVIIDNIQNFALNDDLRGRLFVFLHKHFSKIVMFSSIDFDNLLLMSECGDLGIEKYAMYKIGYLSKALRLELIKKWHNLGSDKVQHEDDTQLRVETSAKIIESVLDSRARLVPAYPMNIIFLLYTESSGLPANTQISQYGFLYETLVNKSLSHVPDITPARLNICVGFLSVIAYYMLDSNAEECTRAIVDELAKKYKAAKKVKFDCGKLISDMLDCNVFVEKHDKILFKYPYIYYYFVSKYIVNNMRSLNVKKKVEEMCSCLYNESYGNIMIFVCHFANNNEIIDNILISAFDTISSAKQFDFSKKQTEILMGVNDKIDKILFDIGVGDEKDVNAHREERLAQDDTSVSNMSSSDCSKEITEEDKESIASLYSAMKIIMVLGQILKNYPGDISGERKVEMIRALHDLGMRIVGDMFYTVGGYADSLIDYLIKLVRDEGDASTSFEISQGVKKLVGGLLAQFAMLMIHLISVSFGNEYALEAADEAIGDSISGRLVLFDIEMNCLAKPKFDDLEKCFCEYQQRGLDFAGLTLKYITHEYLRFNKCGTAKRDHLCDLMHFKKKNYLLNSKR